MDFTWFRRNSTSVGTKYSKQEEAYPGTEFLMYRTFACLILAQNVFCFLLLFLDNLGKLIMAEQVCAN
jgi:hypothetical protein